MKQKIVLLTTTSAFLLLTLTSNKLGPGKSGNGDRTGGPKSVGTCSSSTVSCHAGANGSTTGSIEIHKKSAGMSSALVTSYIRDTAYIVTIRSVHAANKFFGFQIKAVDGANASAGTFSHLPPKVQQTTVGGVNLIEHSSVLSASGSDDTVSFEWKAPSTGMGTVTFYGIVNAVNNSGSELGDVPSTPINIPLADALSINTISSGINVIIYPNPATTLIHLSATPVPAGIYTIQAYDMQGRCIFNNEVKTNGDLDTYINSEKWANGLYQVALQKDGFRKLTAVLKQ